MEDGKSFAHKSFSDKVCNQPAFLRGNPHIFRDGLSNDIFFVHLFLHPDSSCGFRCVSFKSPGWREFPEFMSNHIFRDKNRNKPLSVVYSYRQSNHFRNDCRSAGPSPYDLSLSSLRRQFIDPFQ